MRFCTKCNEYVTLVEDVENRRIVYPCHRCNNVMPAHGSKVYENKFVHESSVENASSRYRYAYADPTLPRITSLPCRKCHRQEIIVITAHSSNPKLGFEMFFACADPECNCVFSLDISACAESDEKHSEHAGTAVAIEEQEDASSDDDDDDEELRATFLSLAKERERHNDDSAVVYSHAILTPAVVDQLRDTVSLRELSSYPKERKTIDRVRMRVDEIRQAADKATGGHNSATSTQPFYVAMEQDDDELGARGESSALEPIDVSAIRLANLSAPIRLKRMK